MTDIETAKAALFGHTLALCKDKNVITSDLRGIAPMVGFIREGKDLAGYSAADKIVGKAAAMLFIKANVCRVYATVMSTKAAELFTFHGIEFGYEALTEKIINRQGTGICPMELAVKDIDDVDSGVKALFEAVDKQKH